MSSKKVKKWREDPLPKQVHGQAWPRLEALRGPVVESLLLEHLCSLIWVPAIRNRTARVVLSGTSCLPSRWREIKKTWTSLRKSFYEPIVAASSGRTCSAGDVPVLAHLYLNASEVSTGQWRYASWPLKVSCRYPFPRRRIVLMF